MPRVPFIAGNWKMYKTVGETVKYVKEFRSLVKDIQDVEIVLAPPFTALHAAAEAARNSNVAVAAQDLHWDREGAFTGQVSGPMIREAGAEYVVTRPIFDVGGFDGSAAPDAQSRRRIAIAGDVVGNALGIEKLGHLLRHLLVGMEDQAD